MSAAVLTLVLVIQAGVRPYVSALTELRATADRERDLLARQEQLLVEVKSYPERLPLAESALLEEAPRLFGGPELATASAALVNHVSGQGIRNRVFVQQSSTGTPEPAVDGVARIHVEVQVVGDLQGILAFLRDLESGPKLLSVDRLVIAQAERVSGRDTDEEMLGMSATVTGYTLVEEVE